MQTSLDKNSKFSDRLKQVIDYYGVTASEFAENLGYQRAQSIYDFLNGKVNPSYVFFQNFAKSKYSAYINYNWLLTGEGEMIDSARAAISGFNTGRVKEIEVSRPWEDGMRLMKILDMDEESSMERLIRKMADELFKLEGQKRELSADHVIELYKNSMRDLYQFAKLESTKVKFFGDAEYIKTEGTTRFFSLGHGMFFLLTILIKENEVKQYLQNCQNLAYVEDFSRYIVTLDKLHFAEYRSFEVAANVGGSCKSHIKPGDIVTGKKLNSNSGRQMEFIQDSECVLAFKDRIIFTQIVGWDAAEGHMLYEDPRNGTKETRVSDLLEIYTIEIVTQSKETRQLSLFPR